MRLCVFLACVLSASLAAAQTPALILSAAAGSTAVVERRVTLDSPPSGPVEWFARADQGWVAVAPRTGMTPRRVVVRVNPAGLLPGPHRATLRFVDDAGVVMLVVPITLSIAERAAAPQPTAPPEAPSAKPGASPAAGPAAGPVGPLPLAIALDSLPVAIRNLPYSQALTVRGGTPPYAVAVVQGRLPLGLTVRDGALTGLTRIPGVFPLTVSATDSATPPQSATKNLTLRVIVAYAGTALSASVSSLALEVTAGQRTADGRVAVGSGAQPLAWSVGADQPWLRLLPDRGMAPGVFVVDVDAARLDPGSYTATITLTMEGAPNSPLRIPVGVTVRR
jgi:hypothetical protein